MKNNVLSGAEVDFEIENFCAMLGRKIIEGWLVFNQSFDIQILSTTTHINNRDISHKKASSFLKLHIS